MKKYEKPQIIIECFELSQNVADCTWNMNHAPDGQCTGDGSDKGLPILFNQGLDCVVYENNIEDYCYTVAMSGKVTFLS